jgi:hypothetical protein
VRRVPEHGRVGRTCPLPARSTWSSRSASLERPCGAPLDHRSRVAPSGGLGELSARPLGEPCFFSADAERAFWDVDCGGRMVLIFGGESRPALRERFRERLVGIPMADPALRS